MTRRNSPGNSGFAPTLSSLRHENSSSTSVNSQVDAPPARSWTASSGGLTRPTQAHIHNDPNSGAARPMHLLRTPSFNPPAFNEDDPPPPMVTPPPEYGEIVDGDPRSALADYFARLADEVGDEDDTPGRGRVDIPLTPGARINRSMDARRDWVPIGHPAR